MLRRFEDDIFCDEVLRRCCEDAGRRCGYDETVTTCFDDAVKICCGDVATMFRRCYDGSVGSIPPRVFYCYFNCDIAVKYPRRHRLHAKRTDSKGAFDKPGLNEEVFGEALRRIFAEDPFLFAERNNEFPSLFWCQRSLTADFSVLSVYFCAATPVGG